MSRDLSGRHRRTAVLLSCPDTARDDLVVELLGYIILHEPSTHSEIIHSDGGMIDTGHFNDMFDMREELVKVGNDFHFYKCWPANCTNGTTF